MHAVGERHSGQEAWQEPRWKPKIPGRFWKQQVEGVRLEQLNMGAGKNEAGKGAGWERVGKGQHILLRQRGVMKDAMIKCSSLTFSLAIVWKEMRRHTKD